MSTFQIKTPDGKVYRVTGDDPGAAMAALKKMRGEGQPATGASGAPLQQVAPGHFAFDGSNIPGYDPQTGEMHKPIGGMTSFGLGAADTGSSGFMDEMTAVGTNALDGALGRDAGTYDQTVGQVRDMQSEAQRQHPWSYLAGQLGGGIGLGAATGGLGLIPQATSTVGKIGLGMAGGAAMGGLYGLGSGVGAGGRAAEAAKGVGIGAAAGGFIPAAAKGVSSAYQGIVNALTSKGAARSTGVSSDALRMLGTAMDADGTRGPVGQANMARAGQDAMLADAGPNARAILDTAIQRGGPGGVAARDAITARTGRAAGAVTDTLDNTMGQPEGITALRTGIRKGSAVSRTNAYDDAYAQPIDYAAPMGQELQSMVAGRVPGRIIADANELMRLDGNKSKQILADIGDDGAVTFHTLPDVRQVDYITRALNQAAESGDGAGALGGQTPKGRAYQNLAREIRDNLRDLVPEYGNALETAADPIRRSQAVKLGGQILSASMKRDQVAEAVNGMTGPEKAAAAQGIRSQLDDTMAQVTRTVQDGDTTAREAVKALKDLSSRANREKVAMVIGDDQANAMFAELDRAATSFDLRAAVAENSKTYARQATDKKIGEMTAPGPISTLAQGKPLNALQNVAAALTGQTPSRVAAKQEGIYSELARVLTSPQSKPIFDAIDGLGRNDQATALMADRIARALSGQRLAYPTTVLLEDKLRRSQRTRP